MTETEAKTKWCPMARSPSYGFVANRDSESDSMYTSFEEASRCIGSNCMMWRWEIITGLGRLDTDTGYCGLAGKL